MAVSLRTLKMIRIILLLAFLKTQEIHYGTNVQRWHSRSAEVPRH